MTRRTRRQLQLVVRRAERDALGIRPAAGARDWQGEPTAAIPACNYGDTAA
jgi:hypothetical protein